MSNVETLERLFEAFHRGDFDGTMAFLDEEVEWEGPPDLVDAPGPYRGHEGVVAGFTRFMGAWEDLRVDVDEFIDAGDHVVALTHWRGRSRGAGIQVDQPVAQVYELRDGKVLRVRQFRERADALAAAGLTG